MFLPILLKDSSERLDFSVFSHIKMDLLKLGTHTNAVTLTISEVKT